MQNYGTASTGEPKGWLPRNRWIIILTVAAVVIICAPIFCENVRNLFIRTSPPSLTFNPMTGVTVIDSLGNNDKQINAGERVKVRLRLTNAGDQPISGFDMVLSTHDSEVEFFDNTLHYSMIGVGDTVWSDDTFGFKLDSTFHSNCVVLIGTIKNVTLAGLNGGVFGEAFADPITSGNTISFSLDVYSLYRLCFGDCKILKGAGVVSDSLVIDVSVCNRAKTTLTDVSVKIDSVGVCSRPDLGFFTPLSKEFSYGDVSGNGCNTPLNLSARFAFAPPAGLPVNLNSFLCVYFVVTIKSNKATVITLNDGIRVKILGTMPPIL
jgi:hypothetical protein